MKIEKSVDLNSEITGLASGFFDLDMKTTGFQPGNLVFIAARPSIGKTSFALNLVKNVVIRNHKPTVIFTLEMSKTEFSNRLLCIDSHIDYQKYKKGNLSENDMNNLVKGGEKLSKSPLILDDTSVTISEIKTKCFKLKLERKIQLVIIDYLQQINASQNRCSKYWEYLEISRNLKLMAKELQLPIIAISQLSRKVDFRLNHRPKLSDLRIYGAIDLIADVVLFIYRDEVYNKDTENKKHAEIIIAKNPSGKVDTVELEWLPQYTIFNNI
jgi:replicative DNA helicase